MFAPFVGPRLRMKEFTLPRTSRLEGAVDLADDGPPLMEAAEAGVSEEMNGAR